MGAPSYLLLGKRTRSAICSACHGAGRSLSRGEAMRADDSKFEEFLKRFTVVTALDPKRPDVRLRPDILDKWKQELKKEAPYAYKDITPVIKTLQAAEIATPVVELFPLMTVKQ
jgi:tRNA-splicing ligase RtcB